MIIGHGDIASVLTDRDDRVYFASGVSNSQEDRLSAYLREVNLMYNVYATHKDKHLVYFSSLSIFYADTMYTRHKRRMEGLIKLFKTYTIIRMGNITWGTNPHTLINFIANKFKNHEPIEIRDVYRYVCDKDEFLHWIDLIPPWSCELNIPGKRMLVKDIVREYCYPWRFSGTFEHDHTVQKLQIRFSDS